MKTQLVTSAHLPEIAALERACFGEPWSEEALALLCTDTAFGIVAVGEDGEVLSYAGMLTVLDEGQVTNVATHPDHRGRGLATAVLESLLAVAVERGLASVSLEVRESNLSAISLYRRFGFAEVGRRKNFYTAPREDALVMVCDLS